MNPLEQWAAWASILTAGLGLVALLGFLFGAGTLYQQFKGALSDIAELKSHRAQFDEKLTTILARCKMCVDEGGD